MNLKNKVNDMKKLKLLKIKLMLKIFEITKNLKHKTKKVKLT